MRTSLGFSPDTEHMVLEAYKSLNISIYQCISEVITVGTQAKLLFATNYVCVLMCSCDIAKEAAIFVMGSKFASQLGFSGE
jgi:hypothetical protein